MSLTTRSITSDFAVAAQLAATDMAQAAAQGFKTVINNRPDGEGGPDQPTSATLQATAEALGLRYVYLPVVSGSITVEQAQALRRALQGTPSPRLAFCRSGARSAQLFNIAMSG